MRKLYKELLVFALILADSAAGQIMPYYLNCAVDIKPVGSSPPPAIKRHPIGCFFL
jgi:hypothetical protein